MKIYVNLSKLEIFDYFSKGLFNNFNNIPSYVGATKIFKLGEVNMGTVMVIVVCVFNIFLKVF